MKVGVVFPQTEIGADVGAIRQYAAAVEQLGYDHVMAYDHVVGADVAKHHGWTGTYSHHDTFHEPLVLFGFLAGITSLDLVTGIIVLPQRQTVLVAKQAAEVDMLSGGRLRLGVGIGWNAVEYEALGMDFHTRGRRIEEQVALMRRLWTDPSIDFAGSDHTITGAGIAPLPVQRPIPIWMAGRGDRRSLERVGRVADGWIPIAATGQELTDRLAIVRNAAEQAGRDPQSLGLQVSIDIGHGDLDKVRADADQWRQLGATHAALITMRANYVTVDAHIDALARAASVLLD